VTKAVTGGVAFAVGKTLDVNPSLKLGKLPAKLEVGASIYKETVDDLLCLRIKSVDLLVAV